MTGLRLGLVGVVLIISGSIGESQYVISGNIWEGEIRKFEAEDRLVPPPRGAVLFIGSSSIRFWRSLQADFPMVAVLNRGFGGAEITDVTHFADRIVIPYRPRMIVFYGGDNDLATGKTPEEILTRYTNFVSRVREVLPSVTIAFVSIKPSPARVALLSKMKEANRLVREYVKRDVDLVFIDVFESMLGIDGRPLASLFAADGLHLSKEGYDLWRKAIAPYLKN